MQALVYEGPRQMVVREVDIPIPNADEVVIRVAYSGICGSELSGYLGKNSLRKPPIIFGHEFSGTIVNVGERVQAEDDLSIGSHVTANPLLTCGHCTHCMNQQQQRCEHRQLLSASLPGSNAEYVKVPARFVYKLPDNVSLVDGALTEPVACAVRIAELASIQPRQSVLVLGMGPIGLFVLQILKSYGVQHLIAVDLNVDRLKFAASLGADVTICPLHQDPLKMVLTMTDGKGVHAAIDAVGSSQTRKLCVDSLGNGGRVIFSGLHESESSLPINDMIRKEITGIGSFAYSTSNFETSTKLLSEKKVGLREGLMKVPLEEGRHWFERLLDNPGYISKVLLCPRKE